MGKQRIWVAPAGSSMKPALGELQNGDLVVPEGDGVRIWPDISKTFTMEGVEYKYGDHSWGADIPPTDIPT